MLSERLAPWVLLFCGVALASALLAGPDGTRKLAALRAEQARIDSEAERLKTEIRRLRLRARAIKEDPSALERAARERLDWVRSREWRAEVSSSN